MAYITRSTDYAIRLMAELARRRDDGFVSAREVGVDQDVPPELARSIVSSLASGGLLEARRGAGGGVRLARDAHEITVLDIIRAVEARVGLSLCTRDSDWCHRADGCRMHGVWRGADAVLETYLGGVRLDTLAI
jgi:Rrf2 family protein